MPTAAPRYQPEGVRVGEMPTPQVRPDNSTANTLASIGETIGSLGKSAQHVIDAHKQANETAGAELAMEWRSRNEARRAKYEQAAIGQNSYAAYDSFNRDFSADTGEDLLADKPQGVKDEFNRRAIMYRRDIQSAADMHQSKVHKNYTLDVAGREYDLAVDQASDALAGGDSNASYGFMAQAHTAEQRASEVSGIPIQEGELQSKIRYRALEKLSATDYTQAANLYKVFKGGFGQYETKAARTAADAVDRTWGDQTAAVVIAENNTKASGLVDWNKALVDAASKEGATPERLAQAQHRISQAATMENHGRDARATQILDGLRAAFMSPDPVAVNTYRKNLSEADLAYLKPADREKVLTYDGFTAPSDKLALEVMITGGQQDQIDRAITIVQNGGIEYNPDRTVKHRYLLDTPTTIQFQKWSSERQTQEGKLRERIQRVTRDVYFDNQKAAPTPEKHDAAQVAQFNLIVESVYKGVDKSNLDKLDDEKIKSQINMALTTIDVAKGNLKGGSVVPQTMLQLSKSMGDISADMSKAGIPASTPVYEAAPQVLAWRKLEADKAAAAAEKTALQIKEAQSTSIRAKEYADRADLDAYIKAAQAEYAAADKLPETERQKFYEKKRREEEAARNRRPLGLDYFVR